MCVCVCASAHINAGPCSRHVICIPYEVGNPIIIAVTGYKWRLEGKVSLWICCELHMTYLKTSAFNAITLSPKGLSGGSVVKQSTCRSCRVRPLGWEGPLERARLLAPAFLPGESHGQRSQVGYSPWDRKESDTAEAT